jgi:hypothetical protein
MKMPNETMSRWCPDVDAINEAVECGVCGATANVTRGIHGSTSFAAAMAGSKRHYDKFECPHHDELWHIQAQKLRQEKNQTASAKIAAILEQEIQQILDNKMPTKEIL